MKEYGMSVPFKQETSYSTNRELVENDRQGRIEDIVIDAGKSGRKRTNADGTVVIYSNPRPGLEPAKEITISPVYETTTSQKYTSLDNMVLRLSGTPEELGFHKKE
jgi:hypothetical protein